MALSLPYPDQPASNSALTSLPVRSNFTAIAQAIEAFDGSQINAGSVTAAALVSSINPNTLLHDTMQPFVQSGCVWSQTSGLVGTMSSGVAYIANSSAMYRVSISGIGSYTFTASKDTYIDIDYNGNVYYSAVSNGGTSPALTANSIRIAKVVTGASAISSIVQTGLDAVTTTGQLNYIYNTNPYATPISTFINSGTASGVFWYQSNGGVKELWGETVTLSVNATFTIVFPTLFNTIQSINLTNVGSSGDVFTSYVVATSVSASGFSLFNNTNSSVAEPIFIFVRGV